MFARSVCTFGPLMRDALLWVPSWLVIVTVNVWLTLRCRPLGKGRWLAALCILSAPLFFPAEGSTCGYLQVFSTLITSLAIVSAARLADYDHAVRRKDLERFRLYAWLSLPVVGLHAPRARDTSRLTQAVRHWGKALFKRVAWELCALLATLWFDAHGSLPWAAKSSLTMLYFVLNLTAFHDLVLGFCVAVGLSPDELFDTPLLSRSPRDFWSRRWNKFISRFALKYVALKWGTRDRVGFTLLLVFGCSGLFHEYFAWGVGGLSRAPGAMMSFFFVQALAVWVGNRLPWQAPVWITQPLTFVWMGLTAPLFFMEVAPALLAFGYPEAWLPFDRAMLWGWVDGLPHPN